MNTGQISRFSYRLVSIILLVCMLFSNLSFLGEAIVAQAQEVATATPSPTATDVVPGNNTPEPSPSEDPLPTETATPIHAESVEEKLTRVEAQAAFTSCAAVTEIPQVECEALVALYNSADGANWTTNTDWLVTGTPCSWYGISCDTGSVSSIDLLGNNLVGVFSVDFSSFSNLGTFDVSDNQLTGDMATIIGYLPTGVNNLFLGFNGFTGTIPAAMASFTNLVWMDVSSNQLTGDMTTIIGNLPTGLERLDMSWNDITGTISVAISSFTNLWWFDVGGNLLTGDMATIIGYLPTGMSRMYLDWNDFTGTVPPSISSFTNLWAFDVGANQLTGDLATIIGYLPTNLGRLDMDLNAFTGTIPAAIGSFTNLGTFNVAGNQLTGGVPPEVGDMTTLAKLMINDNLLDGPLPESLVNLNLTIFHFNNTTLCEPQDGTFQTWLLGITDLQSTEILCALPCASLSIDPALSLVGLGQTVTVDILVADDVAKLYGAQLEISFDPTTIQVVDDDPGTAGVQITPGICPLPDFVAQNSVDNVAGTINYSATSLSPSLACDTGGVLASITFEAIAMPSSPVQFTSTDLSDTNGEPICSNTTDGSIDVTNTCIFSGTVNLQSRSDDSGATFTAVGASAGTFSTTTDAAGYYELIVPEDTYDVAADMALFLDGARPGEFCIANGAVELPPVVLLGGDTNDDCVVNILDLAFMGARFTLSTGDLGFDAKADINADGTINIFDLSVTGANFQKTCPVDWP